VSAWLTGLRSARTRRAYAGDVVAWLGWLAGRDTGVLAAGRVHVDLWAATQPDAGAAASSVRRRLSALSSFYRNCRRNAPGPAAGHAGFATPFTRHRKTVSGRTCIRYLGTGLPLGHDHE
jgi:integrase/recombinase XerD